MGLGCFEPFVAFLAAVLVSAWLGSAPVAEAQGGSTAQARTLFERGRAAAAEERWVEALELFEQSRAIVERPSTLFNIATTLIRLGRAREAIATIEAFERVADPRRDARLLADAANIRRDAQASLRHVTLRVDPPDATVEIDGEVIAGAGAERAATLDPGGHAVVVRAEGHEEARFELAPGDDAREVVLRPLDATLRVVPSVQTATVSVDGTERGAGTLELSLAPGAHELAITADGHVAFARTVELGPGESLTVDAALEPVPEGDVLASPLFWGLAGGGVALLTGVAIVLGVVFGSSTEPVYGGTSNTVLVPLLEVALP